MRNTLFAFVFIILTLMYSKYELEKKNKIFALGCLWEFPVADKFSSVSYGTYGALMGKSILYRPFILSSSTPRDTWYEFMYSENGTRSSWLKLKEVLHLQSTSFDGLFTIDRVLIKGEPALLISNAHKQGIVLFELPPSYLKHRKAVSYKEFLVNSNESKGTDSEITCVKKDK